MNIKPKQKKQKGVALIFALFTIAILFSISTTVVALSMHHRQDSQVMSYNDAALQAANWGLEAAINYMGQPGRKFKVANTFQDTGTQWEYNSFGGNNYDSYRLSSQNAGGNATVAGGAIGVSVQELRPEDLKKFGLNYKEGSVPASGESVSDSNRDTWRSGDSVLIRFQKGSGGLYPLMYPGGFRGQGEEMAYGVVEVVCTEIRTLNQPSTYELMAVANVMQCASGTGDARLPYAANNKEFLVEVPSEKGVLASRIVTANVRQMMASDFMHFIQNGRSWDATGVNLWTNTTAQDRVFIPEGYRESGRLRVDGYDAKDDPENNPLKAYLGDGINGRNGKRLDGSLAFLYTGNDLETDRYAFPGDVTTMRPAAEFERKKIGANNEPDVLRGETAMFSGQLRDATPSLGLPEAKDYFSKINNDKVGTKWKFEVGKGGESVETVRWNQSGTKGVCPDVAQAMAYREDGEGNWEKYGSATPTFATIRIEICGNEARAIKYNAAMTDDRQLLGTSQSSSNGGDQGSNSSSDLNPDYVQPLTDWTNIGEIKNNVISVTGGNVEVVNVRSKVESASGLCEEYVDADSKSGNNFMQGELTIVANVDSSRDQALQSIQQDKNATPTDGGIYKVRAREFWEENPYVNIPPFSARELGISGDGNPNEKKYWPSPAKSSIEREGNVIIGSDIRQNATGASGGQALGIVAKNFIYLNDKSGAKNKSGAKDYDSLNNLVVDAVLMSMDHSVQMDWNNMGGNKYHDDLIAPRREGEEGPPLPVQDAIKDPTNDTQRRFTLNGAIVSGFMDVEGDTTGAGYYDQKFTHDPNLLYNLPPNFPKWSLTDSTEKGCFMDFMMLSYKDHGAILNLGY